MPCERYVFRSSITLALVAPTHERCGATSLPASATAFTVESVFSRVAPPAPYVTLKYLGLSSMSCCVTARSFTSPSGVFGGKNSKEMLFIRSFSF